MDLNPVNDAFNRVAKKQKRSSSTTQDVLEQIVQEIETAIQTIQSEATGSVSKTVLVELKNKLHEIGILGQLEHKHKELNIAFNKYTKQLDRSFIPEIFKAYRNVEFDTHTVNQIIATHLYRDGLFELGDRFINESKEPPESALAMRSLFHEMHTILEAVKNRNLAPALAWISTNKPKLEKNGSDLQLKLHQLQFVEILRTGTRREALDYARTNITPFSGTHFAELQKIMASLLWSGKLDRSPYPELLSPTNWTSVSEQLTGQFCSIIGQSFSSPLSVTVSAGIQGLPPLLKFMTVMAGKIHNEWQTMKQLPVPVELDRSMQFHSVFVCPVSKEQSTEENPPMLMSCGHVLCKVSINKMSKNHSRNFKCPYCPTDIDSKMCRPMYL